MLKYKYNEDCSHYPMCGKTCGLSLEELLWRKNQQIRDLKHDMLTVKTHQLLTIEKSLHAARTILSKMDDYIPTCPYGYIDCVSDPAYIRRYNPKWWEELGMPTECSQAKYYEEDCSCQWYDDEDK